MPPSSPWWRETTERFEHAGKPRRVIQKGRQVGASTIIAPRHGVTEMLAGQHQHRTGAPPLVYAFLSNKRGEASNRLRGVKAILDLLDEPYTERGDTIELVDHPAIFAVITSNYRLNVGEVIAWAWCDEVARWRDETASRSNPAEEVIRSLSPAMITQPNASLWLVSTPLSKRDFHARQFDQGETEHQSVAQGSTWEINPTISVEDTYRLEPHESTRLREFGGFPSDSDFGGLYPDSALVASVDAGRTGRFETPSPDITYYIGVDAAFSSSGDRFGWSTISHEAGDWIEEDGTRSPPRLIVHETEAWRADREPREMARRLRVEVTDRYHRYRCIADQYESFSFSTLAKDVGLNLEIVRWRSGVDIAKSDPTDLSKTQRFKAILAAMLGGQLRLPDDPTLLDEFRSVYLEVTPAGNERIVIPRTAGGHGDRVSAIVLAGSLALTRRAQLPAERMTRIEWLQHAERDRERERVAVAVSSGGGGAPSDLVTQARKQERRTTRFDPYSQPANDCGSTMRTMAGVTQTGRKR